MAVFQYSVNRRPVRYPAIEGSIALSVTGMSPHARLSGLDITGVKESLHVAGVVLPTKVSSGLRNPGKSQLMVVSVTVMAGRRLRY